MVLGYSPIEGDCEERKRSWNNFDNIVDIVGNGCKLCAVEWIECSRVLHKSLLVVCSYVW